MNEVELRLPPFFNLASVRPAMTQTDEAGREEKMRLWTVGLLSTMSSCDPSLRSLAEAAAGTCTWIVALLPFSLLVVSVVAPGVRGLRSISKIPFSMREVSTDGK